MVKFDQKNLARGGPAQVAFQEPALKRGINIVNSRAAIRNKMIMAANLTSDAFTTWTLQGRPRVTDNFHKNSEMIRCPFTLLDSIPEKSSKDSVNLAFWESSLRGIEEHLMISLFGMLPDVIWASIVAKVMERTECRLGDYDRDRCLGFPAKGCASRILPKGAAGISPSKPMHDDNNGMISLSLWTSLTESDADVNLVFLVNGKEVAIGASRLRWVLFMGYIPHETSPTNPHIPAKKERLHHSSFVKPEVEYLATHVLSNLSSGCDGKDWSMDFVNSDAGLRDDVKLLPILRKK